MTDYLSIITITDRDLSEKEVLVDAIFSNIILQKIPNQTEEKKAAMLDYLKKTFHQGGFMTPVSASIASTLGAKMELAVDMEKGESTVDIKTTEKGFSVTQSVKWGRLSAPQPDSPYKNDLKGPFVLPDQNKEFVIKAQGTVHVDLSNDSPAISVTDDQISFGNEQIKSKLNKRSLLQMIIDFFKGISSLFSHDSQVPLTPIPDSINISADSSPQEKPHPHL